MFEGALVESRGQLGSANVRWTAAGSLVLQSLLAAVLAVLPAVRPDRLSLLAKTSDVIAPAIPKPKPIVRVRVAEAAANQAAKLTFEGALVPVESGRSVIRNILPGQLSADDSLPPGPGLELAMGGRPDPLTGISGTLTSGSRGVVRVAPSGPVRVSSGVSTGLLLSAIQPVYPALAKAARVQGTVVVEAMISKAGRIESARAVSGPEMLRGAAVDAVSRARYRPFELNGQTVEVQTTVTLNFKLGG